MTAGIFALVIIGLLAAVRKPEHGLLLTIAAGFLQDPIRKVQPGKSALWVGLVVVFFAATSVGAWVRRFPRWWRAPKWRGVERPARVLVVLVVFSGCLAFLGTSNVLLPVLGGLAYLAPLAALVLGSWLGRDPLFVERAVGIYFVVACGMAIGIVLEQRGYDWELLTPMGEGLILYTSKAVILKTGFFRTPEVASWHCATAACSALILAATRRRSLFVNILLGIMTALLLYGVASAGRRKGLAEVILFVFLYAIAVFWVRGTFGRFGRVFGLTALIVMISAVEGGLFESASDQLEAMARREESAGGITSRIAGTLTALPEVVALNGFFGRGAGTLTQGGQYFGADMSWGIVHEGGLSRVVAELGVPGTLVAVWCFWRVFRVILRRMRALKRWGSRSDILTCGIVALLLANVVVFMSAHQIFGDPFVYLWLGILGGFSIGGLDSVEDGALAPSPVKREVSGRSGTRPVCASGGTSQAGLPVGGQ